MQFLWVTLNVRDMEKSLAFYQEVVGLKLNRRIKPLPGTEIAFLGEGGTEVELIRNDKNDAPNHGADISLGFLVESLDRTTDFLKGKGVPIHSGPFQPGPMVKFLYVLDPDGVRVQFVQNLG